VILNFSNDDSDDEYKPNKKEGKGKKKVPKTKKVNTKIETNQSSAEAKADRIIVQMQ
jgi:hypothetical protein